MINQASSEIQQFPVQIKVIVRKCVKGDDWQHRVIVTKIQKLKVSESFKE